MQKPKTNCKETNCTLSWLIKREKESSSKTNSKCKPTSFSPIGESIIYALSQWSIKRNRLSLLCMTDFQSELLKKMPKSHKIKLSSASKKTIKVKKVVKKNELNYLHYFTFIFIFKYLLSV